MNEQNLAARVERLERKLNRCRWIGLMVVTVAIVTGAAQTRSVIEATKIVVTGRNGKPAIVLDGTAFSPVIHLNDHQGNQRITLFAGGETDPRIFYMDSEKQPHTVVTRPEPPFQVEP